MGPRNTEVLVSGASVAGPTLAWWLHRHGFTPTVVEQNPALRAGLGGHAVDLFGPAVDVAEWMGVLPKVQAARTQTELVVVERPGRRPIQVDVSGLVAGISDRHVEIMRGELTSSSTRPPATTSTTASATRSGPWTRTATGSRSPSSTAHRGASTWSSAPTGCTPTCAGWSSATRPASVTSWAATSGSTPCPTTAASRAGWSAGAPPPDRRHVRGAPDRSGEGAVPVPVGRGAPLPPRRPGGAAAAAAPGVPRPDLGAVPHPLGAGRRPRLLLRLDRPDPDAELVERAGTLVGDAGYSPAPSGPWASWSGAAAPLARR
jgi:hypothetical protein